MLALFMLPASACSLYDFDALSSELSAGEDSDPIVADSGSPEQPDAGSGSTDTPPGTGTGETPGEGTGGAGGDTDPPGPDPNTNLLVNGDFEDGVASWTPVGDCLSLLVADNPRSGSKCLETSNRTRDWEGPGYNLIGIVEPGEKYTLTVWVRTQGESYLMNLTHKHRCLDDPTEGTFSSLGSNLVRAEWSPLAASLTMPDCELAQSLVYVEGAPVGEVFYIDDTTLIHTP